MHISPYEQGNRFNHDPERPKQLLLHKREIMKLFDKTRLEGYTLVPLEVYLKDGRIKMALGVCRGKRMYDKRDAAADRDMAREAARAMRDRERGA
jgi:SsrA-binding protein